VRESYTGAFCGNFATYVKIMSEIFKLLELDITSMYPDIMQSQYFPIGFAEIIKNNLPKNNEEFLAGNYFGVVKVHLLPPQGCRYPVIRKNYNNRQWTLNCFGCVKDFEKKMESKIKKCVFKFEGQIVHERKCSIIKKKCILKGSELICNHKEEDRAFTTTITTPELVYAIFLGYEIKEIFEIQNYKKKSNKLFSKFYLTTYKLREKAIAENNNVLKEMTKLVMNSCTGKLGQMTVRTERKYFDNVDDLFSFCHSKKHKVSNVRVVTLKEEKESKDNEEILECFRELLNPEHNKVSANRNEVVSAFMTGYARIQINMKQSQCYHYNQILQKEHKTNSIFFEPIYSDTDSIYLLYNKNYESKIPLCISQEKKLGYFLPEKPKDPIVEFASLGQKSKHYKMKSGCEKLTQKGVKMNVSTIPIICDYLDSIIQNPDPNKEIQVKATEFKRKTDGVKIVRVGDDGFEGKKLRYHMKTGLLQEKETIDGVEIQRVLPIGYKKSDDYKVVFDKVKCHMNNNNYDEMNSYTYLIKSKSEKPINENEIAKSLYTFCNFIGYSIKEINGNQITFCGFNELSEEERIPRFLEEMKYWLFWTFECDFEITKV